jgi:MFS family permease
MTPPPARTDAPFSLWSIAVPAYGPTVVVAVGAGAVVPIITLSALDLGASPSVAAFTVALTLIADLFFAVPAGALVHRVGERKALMGAAAADAVAALFAVTATSLPALMAAVFAMGFTSSVFLVARQSYLIDAVPFAMRARAMSTLGGVHRIGLFVGPFVGAPIVHFWGPRAGFAVAVAAGVLGTLLVWWAPDLTAEHEEAARLEAPVGTARLLWNHRRTYLTLGLAIAVVGAVRSSRVVLVPLWAAQSGLSASTTAVIFGIAGGVEMLLFYPAGSVMDRFGRVWIAVPCVVVVGLSLGALPLTGTALGIGLLAVVGAIGNGIGSGIVMTLGADVAPVVGRSQFLGGWRFVSVIGGSGAPVLISAVTAVSGLVAACLGIGVLALLGACWIGYWVPAYDPVRRGGETSVDLGSAATGEPELPDSGAQSPANERLDP